MNNPNLQLSPSDTTTVQCTECHGLFFDQKLLLRKVSRFVTGQAEDTIIPFPVLFCADPECGHIVIDSLPKGFTDLDKLFADDEPTDPSESKLILS